MTDYIRGCHVRYWRGLSLADSRAQKLIGQLYAEAIRGNTALDGAVRAFCDHAVARLSNCS